MQHPRTMRNDARKPERAARYHAVCCEHYARCALSESASLRPDAERVVVLHNLSSHHAMQAFAWSAKAARP